MVFPIKIFLQYLIELQGILKITVKFLSFLGDNLSIFLSGFESGNLFSINFTFWMEGSETLCHFLVKYLVKTTSNTRFLLANGKCI